MAHKSKTQRAKASAARQERKAQAAVTAANPEVKAEAEKAAEEAPKRSLFKKADSAEKAPESKKVEKKHAEKPKKKRFQFLRDVKAEMKRVTWPTKKDVIRWSLVVVAALVFFGVYVAVLDNVIITPILVAISGLGA